MELMEKYEKNEEKIRKLQEENKRILRQKKERDKKERLAYLESVEKIVRTHLEIEDERIDLEFLEYALSEGGEKIKQLLKEWSDKN